MKIKLLITLTKHSNKPSAGKIAEHSYIIREEHNFILDDLRFQEACQDIVFLHSCFWENYGFKFPCHWKQCYLFAWRPNLEGQWEWEIFGFLSLTLIEEIPLVVYVLSSLHVTLWVAQHAAKPSYPSINQTVCLDFDILLKNRVRWNGVTMYGWLWGNMDFVLQWICIMD